MKTTKHDILKRILAEKAVAVVRLDSEKNICKMTEALIEGGISIIEITLTTPNALSIISKLKSEFDNKILIGAGSVLNSKKASDSINAGVEFVVSPIFSKEIIDISMQANIASMIGAFTPTEIHKAYDYGADVIKVFPADVVGMSFFKSVLAPMPHLKLMPTGGVSLTNAGDWLKAGACAVGVGSALINKKAIAEGNFEKIRNNATLIISSVKAS